jgi:hypothetical protein
LRKILSVLVALVLVVTLIPAGLVRQASAASAATYFIPDTTSIRDTALLTIDVPTASTLLTRTNAYTTNSGSLTIGGTFAYVAANTMSVKIEQLNLQPNNTWAQDSTHFSTGSVQEDTTSTNRFTAGNLTLFSGMNRITFTGTQGSIQRSDVFYVLYDQIPYIQSLKVISGSTTTNLNEGAQAVVPSQSIMLQGVAKNATKATVSVNGGVSVLASVLDDGTFFSPAMTLKSGLNTIKMSITNGTNTINVARDLYYFDANNPYTDVKLVHSSGNYQLVNNIPQITTGTTTVPGEVGKLNVTMLVPYDAAPFGGTATYVMNTSVTGTVYAADVTSDTIIPGSDGVTPQY